MLFAVPSASAAADTFPFLRFCRKTTLTKHIKRHHPSSPTFSHGSWDSSAHYEVASPSAEYSPRSQTPYDLPEQDDYYRHATPLPLPAPLPVVAEEPRYRTRTSPGSWSAPGHLERRDIRGQLERKDSGESAYLTPPPQHPRQMWEPSPEADAYQIYRLSTPSPATRQHTPSPEPRFVHPRQYPASPSPSVYSSHRSSPQPQYTYPTQTMSAPIPQLEFIPPPPHYQHQHQHAPLFASPLQHQRARRASSTPALDFHPVSGPTPGLGIEFITNEAAHMRRFSEVAGGQEEGLALGLASEVDDYNSGLHSPTMLSYRPSIGGYSSFTSAHFERMDQEASMSSELY